MTTNHDALREAFNAFLLEQHERHPTSRGGEEMKRKTIWQRWQQERRLNNAGWGYAGKAVFGNQRNGFYLKRSNWIWNLLNGNGLFKSTIN